MIDLSRIASVCLAALPIAFYLSSALPLLADTLHLAQGGLVEGEWINAAEQPLTKYLIRTSNGVTLTLPLADVRQAFRESPAQREYAERAPAVENTASGQWELAEWCRQNGLTAERSSHLRRVIELDPNHQRARYALGYTFQNGEWISQGDARRREGYELYRGKWRTPQEIEILEARGRTDLAEKEWLARLRRWRIDLNTEKAATAQAQLAAINDPIAVRPLGDYFARERVTRVKMLYADVLANIQTPEALAVLAERSLADTDEEIFHFCIRKLIPLHTPHISDTFVASLKDANNIRVNRAGMALGQLQDKSAVTPLIDALITKHVQVLPGRPGTNSDSTTAGFSPDGGTFMKKGEGATAVVMHAHNQAVLDALNKLTGVDFGFDQRAWRYWHAQEKVAQSPSSRPPFRGGIELPMTKVSEVAHPLIKHHLSRLRDKHTPPAEFRQLVQRLSVLLAYEATSDLSLQPTEIETPLTRMTGQRLAQRIGLVPILRAGLGMVDPILNLIPSAEVWHLGLYRDEETALPVEYYSKLPHSEPVDVVSSQA